MRGRNARAMWQWSYMATAQQLVRKGRVEIAAKIGMAASEDRRSVGTHAENGNGYLRACPCSAHLRRLRRANISRARRDGQREVSEDEGRLQTTFHMRDSQPCAASTDCECDLHRPALAGSDRRTSLAHTTRPGRRHHQSSRLARRRERCRHRRQLTLEAGRPSASAGNVHRENLDRKITAGPGAPLRRP